MPKKLFSVFISLVPFYMFAQDICEPVYTVPRLIMVNSVSAAVTTDGPDMENTSQNATGQPRTIQMFAGQALQETDTRCLLLQRVPQKGFDRCGCKGCRASRQSGPYR